MNQLPNPVEALFPQIVQAMDDWKKENNTEVINNKVKALLDRSSKEVTMKLLGFNNNWGDRWELDHCNGRAGDSAAGDYLRKCQAEAISEWLTQVPLPTMTPALKARLKKEAQAEYEQTLLSKCRQEARNKATKDLEEVLNTSAKSDIVEKYLKTAQLLIPSGGQ